MLKVTHTVEASEVREGDSIPGLDNGYVVETRTNEDGYMSVSTEWSRYNTGAMPEDTVALTFHTADGEEAYLFCPATMPIDISRRD